MKLVANNLYRGKRPSSFAELKKFGITDVINLQSGAYEFFKDDEYEKENGKDFGIEEHNINCSNILMPSFEQVLRVLRIIEDSAGKVYIHCKWGKDRTGFMCAAYRILKCDWTADQAIKEMYENGFHRWSYFWWVPVLRILEERE